MSNKQRNTGLEDCDEYSAPRGPIQRVVLPLRIWRELMSQCKRSGDEQPDSASESPIGWLTGAQSEDVWTVQGWIKGDRIQISSCPIYHRPGSSAEGTDPAASPQTIANGLFGLWDGTVDRLPRFFEYGSDGAREMTTIIYDPSLDSFARVEAIFETRKLAGRLITIIGIGSFGSIIAELLTRCGVDRVRLVDPDRLEPHNLARHMGLLSDIGRFKTRVCHQRLRGINPLCRVETYEADIEKNPDALDAALDGAKLVFVCTDNNPSRYAINRSCLIRGVPAIYGGAYERAFGGMVLRVIPGQTPCYDCVIGSLERSLGEQGKRRPAGKVPYADVKNAWEYKAEPGLGIDAQMIAMIQAKMGLLTLLRGEETTLENWPADFILWGNEAKWIFPQPLYAQFVETHKREDCPTCELLRKTPEEMKAAREAAEQIHKRASMKPAISIPGI